MNTQEILLWQKEINAESIGLDMTKRCSKDGIMTKRQEVLEVGMTLSNVYIDTPFHDDNWVLLRYRKNKKALA